MCEPVSRLKSVGKGLAGVSLLLEIGDEEFSDRGVIIDDEELYGLAGEELHWSGYKFYNCYKHQPCQLLFRPEISRPRLARPGHLRPEFLLDRLHPPE